MAAYQIQIKQEIKSILYTSHHHLEVKFNRTEATEPYIIPWGKKKPNLKNLSSVFRPTIFCQCTETSEGVGPRNSGEKLSDGEHESGVCQETIKQGTGDKAQQLRKLTHHRHNSSSVSERASLARGGGHQQPTQLKKREHLSSSTHKS